MHLGICVCVPMCMGQQIMKKEPMDLKESKEEFMGEFGRRGGKGEIVQLISNLKK